jgi:branched-chain amino acid transport system ATP-binding protein
MLELNGVETAYGSSQVLFGVSLTVGEREVVGLLGRNGMGKTTTVRAIMGLTPPRAGSILFAGRAIHGAPPYVIARLGIGLVPEGRQVFPNLSVQENLVATARNPFGRKDPWTLGRVYALFPALDARRSNMGNQLSGGEQQMLAIGRALLTNPRLLILDEATEGLAPLLRAEIWRSIRLLKEGGQAILVIDSNLRELLKVTDRNTILEKGRIVWTGDSDELEAQPELKTRYLGI